MWGELRKTIEAVEFDAQYRVIVLASSLEKYFTAGLDCTSLRSPHKTTLIAVADAQSTLAGRKGLDAARQAFKFNKHLVVSRHCPKWTLKCRTSKAQSPPFRHAVCQSSSRSMAPASDSPLTLRAPATSGSQLPTRALPLPWVSYDTEGSVG